MALSLIIFSTSSIPDNSNAYSPNSWLIPSSKSHKSLYARKSKILSASISIISAKRTAGLIFLPVSFLISSHFLFAAHHAFFLIS